MTQMTKNTALITGASRGLGLAVARELARLGWSLILDARGAEALETAQRDLAPLTEVIALPGDVTDPAHRAALTEAARKLGGLDALINNASTLGPSPRPNLLDYPPDALEEVYRTNVVAPLALIQALSDTLKPGACVINVTSDAGVEPYAGWGGYGSSKAALEQITAILAAENPQWRVYWVDPGDLRTQMHQEAFPGEDISDRPLPEVSVPGFVALLTGNYASGRYRAQQIGQNAEADAHKDGSGVQGLRVVVTTADFDRAAALYRDGLGLPVLDQWISAGSKGMLLGAGAATLELVDKTQAAEIDQIEVGRRVAGQVRLAFTVDELESPSRALREQGATAVSEPVVTPWGHRNQRLNAPAGVHDGIDITLSQVVDEKPTEPEGTETETNHA